MGDPILRTYTETFDEIHCGSCGIIYYVPARWMKCKVAVNGHFCCPNGCSRRFVGETDKDRANRLASELEAANSAKEFANRRLADEQTRHAKELKRIGRRSNAGVCQKCHRTFNNVARHMKTKHPEERT